MVLHSRVFVHPVAAQMKLADLLLVDGLLHIGLSHCRVDGGVCVGAVFLPQVNAVSVVNTAGVAEREWELPVGGVADGLGVCRAFQT